MAAIGTKQTLIVVTLSSALQIQTPYAGSRRQVEIKSDVGELDRS